MLAAMISFLTLFLGLMAGSQRVALIADPSVSAVELRIDRTRDGRPVAARVTWESVTEAETEEVFGGARRSSHFRDGALPVRSPSLRSETRSSSGASAPASAATRRSDGEKSRKPRRMTISGERSLI